LGAVIMARSFSVLDRERTGRSVVRSGGLAGRSARRECCWFVVAVADPNTARRQTGPPRTSLVPALSCLDCGRPP